MGHWTGRAADSRCGFAGKQSVLPDRAPGLDWPATKCHTDIGSGAVAVRGPATELACNSRWNLQKEQQLLKGQQVSRISLQCLCLRLILLYRQCGHLVL